MKVLPVSSSVKFTKIHEIFRVFNYFFQTLLIHQILRYFVGSQTGIQTAYTRIFRQINLLFPIFSWHWSWQIIPKCMCTVWNLNSKWITWPTWALFLFSIVPIFSHSCSQILFNCHSCCQILFNYQLLGRDLQKIIHLCSCIRYANALTTWIIFIRKDHRPLNAMLVPHWYHSYRAVKNTT